MAGHIQTAGSADWCTPPKILDAVRVAFGGTIDLDPCSNEHSTVGALHSWALPLVDGLALPWDMPNIFVNPPFGVSYLHKTARICISAKEKKSLADAGTFNADDWQKQSIADWVHKAVTESMIVSPERIYAPASSNNKNIIMLIPAAVDTAHWQKHIFEYAGMVCFLKGRVHFHENGKPGGPAPMACAVVGFGPHSFPANEDGTFYNAFRDLGRVVIL